MLAVVTVCGISSRVQVSSGRTAPAASSSPSPSPAPAAAAAATVDDWRSAAPV